jgi:hypothetical protein
MPPSPAAGFGRSYRALNPERPQALALCFSRSFPARHLRLLVPSFSEGLWRECFTVCLGPKHKSSTSPDRPYSRLAARMQPFQRIAPASPSSRGKPQIGAPPSLVCRACNGAAPIAGSGSSSAMGLIEQRLFSEIIAGRVAPPHDDGKLMGRRRARCSGREASPSKSPPLAYF